MKKVIIYSTPSCAYCQMAKKFFKENNIDFQEKNVAEDIPAQKEMIEKSGQMGVPVIEIDGSVVIGFNQPAIKELLGI